MLTGIGGGGMTRDVLAGDPFVPQRPYAIAPPRRPGRRRPGMGVAALRRCSAPRPRLLLRLMAYRGWRGTLPPN